MKQLAKRFSWAALSLVGDSIRLAAPPNRLLRGDRPEESSHDEQGACAAMATPAAGIRNQEKSRAAPDSGQAHHRRDATRRWVRLRSNALAISGPNVPLFQDRVCVPGNKRQETHILMPSDDMGLHCAATFSGLIVTEPGTYQLEVASPGSVETTSDWFDVTGVPRTERFGHNSASPHTTKKTQ